MKSPQDRVITFNMRYTFKTLLATGVVAVGVLFGAQSAQAATHTVQSGDTLAKLFPSTWQAVCSHYGINCNLIYPGQTYSDDNLGATTRVAGVSTSRPTYQAPSQPAPQYRASGGHNGYGPGWCTWYVKERRPDIGGYWGNAGYNWITAAQNAGFQTGYAPRAGAIGVMAGHVVYVESVNGNGTVNISEMGWNYTAWNKNYRTVPASSFTYIY